MELLAEHLRKPMRFEPKFPQEEYDHRLAQVRGHMHERGIDLLLLSNTPNISYLTGYETTMSPAYSIAVVPLEGDVWMHVPELEVPCVLLNTTIRDVLVYQWYDSRSTAEQLGEALRERGADGKIIGIEMGNPETFASGAFDVRSFLTLQRLLPSARFVDVTYLVLDVRVIKSPQELEYMRRAGEYTWAGLKASIDAVAEGVTDNEIASAGYAAMIAAGSELMSIDPMVMVGYRTGYMPHTTYKRTPAQLGDTVYLEYSGCHERYNAPSMRSAVVGAPSSKVRMLADVSLETLELLLGAIRPGRTGDDIAREVRGPLDRVADEVYFHGGFGYSIGMGFQPSWTESHMYIAEGEERELEPGMTFHLPMCIWIPGECGIGFSESVVVTPSGCELLTPGKDRELAIRGASVVSAASRLS